jgi:molybdate transport system substrate-binding protein
MRRPLILAACLAATGLSALPACAETALLAVATNFAGAAEKLAADYGAASGDTVTITAGATGKLYAQITAGAPFDAFLSADIKTPAKLESEGTGVAGTAFSYATGTLVLWSPDPAADLSDPRVALTKATHVAIANPDLAPYGAAAVQAIEKLGLLETLKDNIVMGENIGQAQTMVASGAAELGFVAASGLTGLADPGASWTVPAEMHAPLTQGAILLVHGAENTAAQGFLAYLASDAGQATLAGFGYGPGQ